MHDGFISLWPTTLLQRRLPGAEAANRALVELILDLDARNTQLTTDYLKQNFITMEHPAVHWLHECVNKTAVDYLARQGMDYDVRWQIQAWVNINRYGDYHDLHNHPHSYLSGTYYVQVPEQEIREDNRNDITPGAISFYDPRPQANMNAIRGDAQISAEHSILPVAGAILMWPSFLHHFVHPNLSRQPRISVSFNLLLQWSDAYLPARG
jgi:uncharacterized protein (TIGR02466 family)